MGGSQSTLKKAERDLLNGGLRWYTQWREKREAKKVDIDMPTIDLRDVPIGDGMHIHTVEYTSADSKNDKPPLVCMHGFGTGVGIYYAALPALAQRWGGRVIAIDTLGCGLSSRPRWKLGHGTSCKVDDAEAFFVDGIERWREAMRIDKMVLMGHSLGGYIGAAYTEAHADRVAHLMLVSAVGTPEPPSELVHAHKEAPFPFNMVLGAWSNGWSPFTVAKCGLANTILSGYVRARFSDASWVLKPLLKDYLVGSWTDGNNSAGGYAHATLLRPGGIGELAYARRPMGTKRLPNLPVARISAVYGEYDWMDWRNMAKVRKSIQEGFPKGPNIEILHVAGANHNVMVDNPLGFVDAVMAALEGAGHGVDGKIFGRRYHAEDRQSEQASPRMI